MVYLAFADRIGSWHRWFAWYPVRTYDQRIVWFRIIWRACFQKPAYLSGLPDMWFVYSIEQPKQPAHGNGDE